MTKNRREAARALRRRYSGEVVVAVPPVAEVDGGKAHVTSQHTVAMQGERGYHESRILRRTTAVMKEAVYGEGEG